MEQDSFNAELLSFLDGAPTPFHAAASLEDKLLEAGFRSVDRVDVLSPGETGIVLRVGGSIVALRPGQRPLRDSGLRMVGAHTDSPCLMVKPRAEQHSQGYLQLGIEVYGGALLNPWFDRDLSLAGRVSFESPDGAVTTSLVDVRDPIAVVPSLAIHLDREANKNRSVNAQTQMSPLLALQQDDAPSLREYLARLLQAQGSAVDEVLDYELCFYDTQAAALIGLHREFIASARLDNLLSCFIGLSALRNASEDQWCVLVCNDHEEVGSLSASGAQGPMLRQCLQALLDDPRDFAPLMHRSMMISADNAHGVHPNYADKHDARHGPMLNGGPVIKVNASQRYASSSDGAALFRVLAREESVPVQSFAMRADMGCGSTIGPITAGELGVTTLDIGVPTLAMHSVRELAGSEDAWMLQRVLTRFFNTADPLMSNA